jgi:hypothetical protein
MDISALSREIALKAEVMIEGMRIDEEALEEVGTKYLEDISSVFGYYLEGYKPGTLYPSDFKMPLGTVTKVTYNAKSPFFARKEDGVLILEKNGKFLSTIEWVERPAYYDKVTSDGVEMKKVAQIRGECALIACPSVFCINWKCGDQCRYCNINAAQQVRKGEVATRKKPQQIAEVAAAAIEEGINIHLILSGGTLPERKAVDIFAECCESIREYTGLEKAPGCVNMAAPIDLSEIDRLYQAGALSLGLDLEVWNPYMFQAICPGKSKLIGRDNWLRALEYGAEVFGQAYVFSGFVLGLEEKDNYYEAADYLADKGVFTALIPWIPLKGSKLEGHRPPHAEWMLEVNEKVMDIMVEKMPIILTEEFWDNSPITCYRCATIDLFWDEIRKRLGGKEMIMPKDQKSQAAKSVAS